METPVIVAAARTGIGKFQGTLSPFTAPQLGSFAIKEAAGRAEVGLEEIEEIIMGNVLQAGVGQNPARQAALAAGCPGTVSAVTINKVCGSGLKSIMFGAQAIACGDTNILVAGGMESMTNAPYLLPDARAGQRLGHGKLLDALVNDGLWCPFEDWHMGEAAEHVANLCTISREDQDAYAAESQQRAEKAWHEGKFKTEILKVEVPQRKGDPVPFEADEGIRPGTTLESLGKLRPAFKRDGGTVTPGNASTINDGAAAVVMMSETEAQKRGAKILGRIKGQATAGVDPKEIFLAPVYAMQKLSEKTGTTLAEIDLFEVNEAFAAQVLADSRKLELDLSRVNIWGGAIALGHPIGASGARVLVTLLSAMAEADAKTGVACLCLGGGNAVALEIER